MKRVAVIFLFLAGSVGLASAQASQDKSDNYKNPAISKEIHRLGNKNKFKPLLVITSGDVSSVVSKDIHKKQSASRGYVSTNGYPTWTISKGVVRQQAERAYK